MSWVMSPSPVIVVVSLPREAGCQVVSNNAMSHEMGLFVCVCFSGPLGFSNIGFLSDKGTVPPGSRLGSPGPESMRRA